MESRYQDYVNEDYRAFVFATHPTHGMLLLHCTRKKKKPPHFQVPGGHLDKEDFQDVLSRDTDNSLEGPTLLVAASRIAAVRELYEETGIDLRSKLERLKPVRLQVNSHESLFCQFKKRMFYKVILKDSDFCTTGSKPMGDSSPPLMLNLSEEHQGFRFVSNMSQAVLLLVEHSGGKVSKALEMAMSLEEIIPAEEQGKMEDEIL